MQLQPHLGKTLRQLLRQRNIKPITLARQMGYDYRSVYLMFKRKDFNTALLRQLSDVLNHNMFQYLQAGQPTAIERELTEKIIKLETENAQLKKENQLLTEIVRLKK